MNHIATIKLSEIKALKSASKGNNNNVVDSSFRPEVVPEWDEHDVVPVERGLAPVLSEQPARLSERVTGVNRAGTGVAHLTRDLNQQ